MKNFLSERLKYNKHHLLAFGLIAVFAHPAFWFWWTYIYPNPYENISLRIIGALSCIALLFFTFYEEKYKNFLKFYWLFIVIYNLPFFFTVNLIKNGLIDVWLMEEIVMIFVVILFIPNIFIAIFSFVVGIGFAIIFCKLTGSINIYPIDTFGSHSIQYALAFVAGYIFNFSNIIGIRAQERAKSLESLGGSIAHEMRNPLGSIHQSTYILIKKLHEISQSRENNRIFVSKEEITELEELIKIIDHSSIRGNMVIDMILSNIKSKEIDKSTFKIYKISEAVDIAIKEFAFAGSAEKNKVSSNIDHDFYFKGNKNMLIFVLFNLLKNALYYLKTHPKSKITISTKKEDLSDKKFNYLYFRDTGPGIPKDKLESIFESFMTSGKAEGTGLGLPFCRRVISAFGGSIICNSKLGEYTEFVISFPKLDKEYENKKELSIEKEDKIDYEAIIKEKHNGKTILVVDDQIVNRKISANRLENLNFIVYTAEHSKEALEILEEKGNEIDIIFMDLQMPEIDGYKATKLIKEGKKNEEGENFKNFINFKDISIIAFTGDEDDKTIAKIKAHDMQGYIGKSWNNKQLLEVLDGANKF